MSDSQASLLDVCFKLVLCRIQFLCDSGQQAQNLGAGNARITAVISNQQPGLQGLQEQRQFTDQCSGISQAVWEDQEQILMGVIAAHAGLR